jgi:hypothetical protein
MGISPRAIRFNYWTPLAGWNASDEMQAVKISVGLKMVYHALHQRRDIPVPLVPVMAARYGVELITEMPGLQHRRESAVCGEQTF